MQDRLGRIEGYLNLLREFFAWSGHGSAAQIVCPVGGWRSTIGPLLTASVPIPGLGRVLSIPCATNACFGLSQR